MRNAILVRAIVVGAVFLMAAPTGGKGELSSASRKEPLKATPLPRNSPTPKFLPKPAFEVGRASWYGEKFQGHATATGEQFDMFQLTAAHRTLPMGSVVRVTHLRTRRSVVVRINDRGPVLPNLILDLSYAAAQELGILRQGVARVRLDVIKMSHSTRVEPIILTPGE